jgi:pentatricopeptide repeat protein
MFYLLHCSSAIVPVGQDEDSFGPQALDLCLRRQKWEQALGILDEMVKRGEAVNGAVDGAQADPREIRGATLSLSFCSEINATLT